MRLIVVVLILLLPVWAGAAINPPATESAPVTAKELRQGYRENVIIARPRAAWRGASDRGEAGEGVRVREKFPCFGDLRIIELADGDDVEAAIERLRATGRYEFVQPDYLRHVTAEPADPRFTDGSQWALRNNGNANGIAGADIDAAAAWDIIHDAPNVVVAVIDTGVNLAHQDLAANLWTNPSPTFNDLHGARFVNGASSGNPTDDNGHGTHVAGTIGAVGGNNVAVAGIAWRVQIMAVKVFPASGSGSTSDIIKGINYAVTHGAHIINASYGETGSFTFSPAELAAITAARDAGVIFVAAAGNAASNMDVTRFYPGSHALDNIVTVGASTRRDELASFSNYGSPVDLFAPGSEILSLSHSGTTGTTTMSGTSMAAPHVTGALALLKARFPSDNYRQLINRLLRGVDPLERFVGKAQTGGRLNLLNALNTASDPNGHRPFNDDFARRPRLNGDNLQLRASNAGATAEANAGEPPHAGSGANASLWWQWTAPTTGTIALDTAGSDYNTLLAVYTGGSLGALTLVASNDDDISTITSRVSFTAQAGTTYQFAVDGKSGQTGLTLLTLGTTPANDAFAAPTTLEGTSAQITATNAHGSREPGEPTILGWPGGRSLWYRWVAPRSGRFQVSATSADFDPVLGVFTGATLGALKYEAENAGTADTGPVCTFTAIAGATYLFYVDTRNASTVGHFTLSLTDSAWQGVVGGAITSSASVAADGTVYFGSSDRSLYAFNPDGTKKWSYPTNGLIDTCSPAIANDGTVYVGSNDGRLWAFTPAGTFKWWHDFGSNAPVSNSPALAVDGTIYVKAGDGYLYALNPADGATKWRRNVFATESYASPVIAPDGTIYQGSENKNLYAINPADGSIKWTFPADNDIYTAPAIDAAGNIYFSVLNSGKLFSVSPAGALRWTYAEASLGSSSSPALSADGGTVYYAAYDGKLHAVNAANGAKRWEFKLGNEVRASSPAVDADGVIYIGCYDFKLYAINPNGTPKRTWDTGGWIRSSPLISGTTLYVGSNDHKLYAFDLGVGAAAGPWPQYRQNARRIGRALLAPSFTQQPVSQTVVAGAHIALTAAASGDAGTYRWQRNGVDIAGATSATLALNNVQPDSAGIYTAIVTNAAATTTTTPAIVGVASAVKAAGAATEVGSDIVHPRTGFTYDQILLQGAAATVKADPGEIVRLSFLDLQDDIVQVEFSGAGTLSLSLDAASGPATPLKYHQPDVVYMKGHASIVVAGADETTNLSVFSVGRANAVNLALFREGVAYDGFADIASVAILSDSGKFGGVRTANGSYFATKGITGIYAPGVQFLGPVYIGEIDATDTATPVIRLGSAAEVQINGGALAQSNARAIQVSGFTQLRFVPGTDSHGNPLAAKANQGRLEQNGADITSQVVVNPAP